MDFDGVPPIGRNVAKYRKSRNLSGEELAQVAGAGLTRSIIANLENGRKNDVTVTQLIALAYVLGVTPAALLYDLMEPYDEVPIVVTEDHTVTAQEWNARAWFTEDSRHWRFPVRHNGERKFQPFALERYTTRKYLLERRAELLEVLRDMEKQEKDWIAQAEGEAAVLREIHESDEWARSTERQRDIKAELYEVEGQLRAEGVAIDAVPDRQPPAPF